MYDTINEKGVDIKLTLNGIEWINVGKYIYTDPIIERLGPVIFDSSV